MREERLGIVKKVVRSVIITFPTGVTLGTFLKQYRQLVGTRLPTREFGFTTDLDFLHSLHDVVRIQTDKNGEYQLNCIADESTEHIQKLVVKQRIPKPRHSGFNNYNSRKSWENTSVKTKPFVSAELRKLLFQVLSDFPDGLSYHSLLLAYRKTFKRPLNLEFLSENNNEKLGKLALAVPELEVRVLNDTERLFYCPLSLKRSGKICSDEIADHGSTQTSPNKTKQQNDEAADISAIPKVVKKDFETVLKLYPDGVLARHFPFLYEKVSGEIFDLLDLGYNNFLELADALPEIFICVKSYKSPNDWRLFHKIFSENAAVYKIANDALELSAKRHPKSEFFKQDVLSDIALPTHSYTPPQFPSDANLSAYFPVFISAVVNPSCFWFKLQFDEVVSRFRELEEEMHCFYHSSSANTFKMLKEDINIGSTCVALHEDFWYRVTVTSTPIDNIVNVFLVDYGSWEKVHCSVLRYLKSSFISLPSQAFKGQLASVKPTNGMWSKRAEARFLQLCNNFFIMAQIHLEFEDIVSVLLCDTSEDYDVHINDTLIDEGLAENCPEDVLRLIFPEHSTQNLEAHKTSNTGNVLHSEVCSNGKEIPETEAEIKEVSCNTSKKQLKLVKRIHLSGSYIFHFILVSKEAYISAGDLCNLFWCDKPAELLKERLEFKNIEIPTISISKEEHKELFQQCENYSVQGFKAATVQQYSVLLYPLTHVMEVLNCLGHPSVDLREIIIIELETISNLNGKWIQFSKDIDATKEISNENQDGIDKYSMYDLKALFEAIKCKRMKLQKNYNETSCDNSFKEIMKLEALSEIIKKRMKDITSICTSYAEENQQLKC